MRGIMRKIDFLRMNGLVFTQISLKPAFSNSVITESTHTSIHTQTQSPKTEEEHVHTKTTPHSYRKL